jgi:CRP-like cAMP-binding protein
LRVIYIEQQTGRFSRAVADLIARQLAAADPALAGQLSRRYRVELARVQHSQIARYCQPRLLAAADTEFNWLE